jgi:hypothetical protein
MATYIQGVQDRVESLRPPQQNLQQNASMLQTLQSRYDKNHDAVSEMYGTILNAGLTRENNVKAREDFFKLIDSDIQKVANLDLSKRSEQDKAKGVFSQIYDNQYLVKDMVWTKGFQQEMKRAEAFKNCVDPEKCGGQYWDEGVKYMQYKRQEFASTDDNDSLTFSNAEYVPYNNVMDKALKEFKDMGGFDMQGPPQLSPDGKYWVTTKNGQQSIKPLTAMFSKLYKDNPQLNKQFEVLAHNKRKDWAAGQVQAGNFESMNQAEAGYIKQQAETLNERVTELSESIGSDDEVISKKLTALEEMRKNGKMLQGSKEHKEYQELQALKQMSGRAKAFTETAKTAMKNANNHSVVRNIGAQLDQAAGMILLDQEIGQAAGILAYKDYEVSIEADEFAKMKTKHQYDVALEGVKHSNRMKMEQFKIKNKHSSYADKNKGPISVGKTIEAESTKRISKTELAKIKANAKKNFPLHSSTELDKMCSGCDKDSQGAKKRRRMEEENRVNSTKQQDYILRNQAEQLDASFGTNYSSQLSVYGSLGNAGGVQPTAGGGGDALEYGVVQGGAKDGAYNYGKDTYKKQGGQWFKKVKGSYQPLTSGNVSERTATLEKGAKRTGEIPEATFSEYVWDADQINEEQVQYIAQNHGSESTREYWNSALENAKKEGVSINEYMKAKPKAEQEKVFKNYGKRIDQAQAHAEGGQEWEQSRVTVTGGDKKYEELSNLDMFVGGLLSSFTPVSAKYLRKKSLVQAGHAGTELVKGIKPNLKGKQVIAQKLTSKYIDSLDENSDEFKDMQKSVERMLLKYGEVNGSELTYNGQKLGLVYYQPMKDIGDETYNLFQGGVGITYGAYTSRQGQDGKYRKSRSGNQSLYDRGVKLITPGRTHQLDKKTIKKIINNKSGGNFADILYKHKISKNISFTEDDFWKSDEAQDYTRAYKEFDSTVQIYNKAKLDNREDIVSSMNSNMGATEYFGDYRDEGGSLLYEAEDFIDEKGNWAPNLNTTNSTTRSKAYKAYLEATDQVYVEKAGDAYLPGLGNRYANKMVVQQPDLTVTGGASGDIRNYLGEMSKANLLDDGAFRIDGKLVKDQDAQDRVINKLKNGEIDIETVRYTPLGGEISDPRKANQRKGEWQRMEIVTEEGETLHFDLYNDMHTDVTLFQNSTSSPKTHALNAAGSYHAVEEHPVTNDQPITIRKTGRHSLEVVGELYRWDETQGRAYYDNISDLLNESDVDISGYTPEQVEGLLNGYIADALTDYKNHTPVIE